MGLKVNKKIYSPTKGEVFDSIYGRIEMVNYQKQIGRLSYHIQFYTHKNGPEETYPYYFEDNSVSSSCVFPVRAYFITSSEYPSSSILTLDDSGSEIYGVEVELPLYNISYITSSVDVTVPIYEEQDVTESVTYTDYDEEGNLKEYEETNIIGTEMVQVSESIERKTKSDHDLILSSSIYDVVYDVAKERLEDFFGTGTIEDVI